MYVGNVSQAVLALSLHTHRTLAGVLSGEDVALAR